MTNRPHLLLWTNNPGPYLDAMHAAGLDDRVQTETLPSKEKPSDDQRAHTNVLMVPNVPPGLLPTMPNLQWAQAHDSRCRGVARAARPAAGPDADLRARHAHGIDAGKHPRRAVLCGQALRRDRRGPEATEMGRIVSPSR